MLKRYLYQLQMYVYNFATAMRATDDMNEVQID